MSTRPLRVWSQKLLHPVTPGMDEQSPRARWPAFAVMMLALSLQVVCRYEFDVLNAPVWQGVHVIFGLGVCFVVMRLFHGPELFRRVRPRTWALLLLTLVSFFLFWHAGRIDTFNQWLKPSVDPSDTFAPVYGFMYFSTSSLVTRLVLPFGLAWVLLGLRPGHLGLWASGNEHPPALVRLWPLYLALFLAVLPFVVYVADTEPFLRKYPMGRAMIFEGVILLEHFLVHELFYLLIFVSGEAFWRGFMTFSLERDFGLYALALMIVPYVTAHFGKPLPETLGAIVAGGLLGWLALKHRSVWLGVAVHYAVALTMDLLAIRANGFTIAMP